jgi:hypothetical protein
MTGRPPIGPALVDALPGSDRAKHIVRTLLETISGARTIDDAAEALDCNRAYVHALRERLLIATIAAAEPRTPGPKPKPPLPAEAATAIAEAHQRARDAQVALELERCRSELALVLGPRLVQKNR